MTCNHTPSSSTTQMRSSLFQPYFQGEPLHPFYREDRIIFRRCGVFDYLSRTIKISLNLKLIPMLERPQHFLVSFFKLFLSSETVSIHELYLNINQPSVLISQHES